MRNVAISALAVLLWACGGGNSNPDTSPDAQTVNASMETLQGTVALTGSEPAVMISLRLAEGGSVDLVGAQRDELGRLSGAVVSVTGTRGPGGRSFTAESYEVVSVNGETPVVGVMVERDGAVWIEGDEQVRLTAVSDNLRGHMGAKMWITGRRSGDSMQVQSYGVIREPGS